MKDARAALVYTFSVFFVSVFLAPAHPAQQPASQRKLGVIRDPSDDGKGGLRSAGRDSSGDGFVRIDFETEDDFVTPLVNGQVVSSSSGFTRLLEIRGLSASGLTAAVFDSDPSGPNASSSDPDLLVDQGNVLILQELPDQSVPGIYDSPDDDRLGGSFSIRFEGLAVAPKSIDLVDICPIPDQTAVVTLMDLSGNARVYTVPAGWTEDVAFDGPPGFRTLDLTTLDEQPGYTVAATAVQDEGFDPLAVPMIFVQLDGSGALDNLVYDPFPGPFEIVDCSLGCTVTEPGELGCTVVNVHVNEEIRVKFSEPVDLSSVTFNTFQVHDAVTGKTPPATFSLDPEDDRTLIYQPRLTFDSSGNPLFGFEENSTYGVFVPGTILDPFPLYIRSTTGEANEVRLRCTLDASLGVLDPVPGPPQVFPTVDVVDAFGEIVPDQPADGATDVSVGTDITFVFDDFMNPATVVNLALGESPTITIAADPDGDPADPSDQFPIEGHFTITFTQNGNTTVVVFDPDADLPRASGSTPDLQIVVTLAPEIEDLAGNPLLDPGSFVFQPEP